MADDASRLADFRRLALAAYFAVFIWSLFVNGLPVDRLAVLSWMLGAFLAASVGRTHEEVKRLVLDWFLLVLVYMIYDYSRGTADQWGIGVNYTLPRDLDRFMLLGRDASYWMQYRLYHPGDVRWYDVAGSGIYMMHFILPVIPLATLRVRNRAEWLRYMRRFSLTLYIAVLTFIALPTAPPWMAARDGYLPYVRRITSRGWWEIGLKTVSTTIDRGAAVANAVAAFPSLHSAMALLVALWFTRNCRRWVRIAALAYPLAMMVTLVYFGEHWVVDCFAGWAIVLLAWRIADRWESRHPGDASSPTVTHSDSN